MFSICMHGFSPGALWHMLRSIRDSKPPPGLSERLCMCSAMAWRPVCSLSSPYCMYAGDRICTQHCGEKVGWMDGWMEGRVHNVDRNYLHFLSIGFSLDASSSVTV